ncbi:ABC transporter permease [Anaerolineales bacterium HSG24]|nr:ABC transporter permease [Anaerolineales bacterium HSG24]
MEILFSVLTVSLFAATIRSATPLVLAALGGIFSERSGIVNIALEGIMLIGAFFAMMISFYANQYGLPPLVSALTGMVGAMVFGFLISMIHAVVSIRFRADQVVGGVAINILALGLTGFLLQLIFETSGNSPSVPNLAAMPIPILASIPILGGIFFNQSPIVYVALLAVPISSFVLFRTPLGLRLRAVGEHPKAADTVGVNVFRLRYLGVGLSGVLAGLAGSYLSLGQLNIFTENMTNGRGFIALAAVIFGKWNPWGAFGACLLFGFADAIQISLQNAGVNIPSDFLLMLPYILTLVALAGFIGRSRPPAAAGVSYEK